jgi:hypothetical protein
MAVAGSRTLAGGRVGGEFVGVELVAPAAKNIRQLSHERFSNPTLQDAYKCRVCDFKILYTFGD